MARTQTTLVENASTSNDQDLSSTNDQQSSDNILRKSVQFVSRKFFYFKIIYTLNILDYIVQKMDMSIIRIV